MLREGYRIPFRRAPVLSGEPIPFSAYCPSSIRGKALEQEVESLLQKGAIELAPLPSLGYYNRLFVVMKASRSWRPVIDLSLLYLRVLKTPFKMETIQSTLLSVRRGDWMVSIDLKDAYLQVPIHPDSRKYLRFMAFNKVYQFKVLCFGLSMAPQVFTRVMAPVSAILHTLGIHLRRYLDDWLIQASSREQVLLSLRTVLHLCNSLGIVVNWEKSQLVPTQRICYLGVLLDSVSFRASPAQKRVDKLLSIGDVFLSSVEQPAKSWLELLGVLSSLTQRIPGGRLRMRSFQFVLHRHWDRVDPDALVRWSPEIEHLSGRVCGQHDCSGLPEESGRYQVGGLESHSSRSAAVDGAPLCVDPSSVHYGPQQCSGGRPVSAQSNSGLRMDIETVCVPSISEAVAGVNRSFCNISQSPLHTGRLSLIRQLWDREGAGLSIFPDY